jgi:D-inositol-3-phosphate glycosyltransferase
LIQAIRLLYDRDVRVCLAVIGGDPDGGPESDNAEMEHVKMLREQAGLEDLVTFLGKRSQDSLPYYYSAAEAVVVPSHYESFGMVALEAMACGTPVVASQVGGLAFLVQDGETGFTVPVDDPQALAIRLSLILQDRALRRKMGERALQVARQYAWEIIAGRMIELYSQVLSGRKIGLPVREGA